MLPTHTGYRRVDSTNRRTPADDSAGNHLTSHPTIRLPVIALSAALCIAQAIVTITASNVASQYPTSTLISVMGFAAMAALALAVNPVIRTVFARRVRPLARLELIAVFSSLMVTAGVSTFGLTEVLVPLIATPWNPEWNTPQRGWDTQLHPYLRHELYITDPDAIHVFREGVLGQPPQNAPWKQWLAFYGKVIDEIPWMIWLRPLGAWSILVAGCYGLFWALAYLLVDTWARREKLLFPLAKLPDAILPLDDGSAETPPPPTRHPLFWTGCACSFGILAYNAAVVANWLPLERLPLGISQGEINAAIQDTFLSGLVNGGPILVQFTCIAIAFLLPLEISFSIWFYFLMGRLLILVLVQLNYGANFNDFPSDWIWVQNPISALGMGGILLFSSVTLWRTISQQPRRGMNGHQASAQYNPRKTWVFFALGASFATVTAWLCWNRLSLPWAAVVTVFLVLITVGLMRIVAETGVFWLQSNASIFHLYKALGLGGVVAPTVMAPLILIYSVLFLDLKTFIAPNVLNAAKMQSDLPGGRIRFHMNIAICMVSSVVTSVAYAIILAYSRGAQQMNDWFYSNGPRLYCEQAARAITLPARFDPGAAAWLSTGAAWIAITMFLRQTIFWFPHPIGFLMNINPLMQYLWFSFLLGWMCKKITIKYGAKATFDLVRLLMLGLLVGELAAIFVAGTINLLPLNVQIPGVDLNRYAP